MSDVSESDLFVGDRRAWARAMNGDNPEHYEPDLTDSDEDEDDERDVEDEVEGGEDEAEDGEEEDVSETDEAHIDDEEDAEQHAARVHAQNGVPQHLANAAATQRHRTGNETLQEQQRDEDEESEDQEPDYDLEESEIKKNLHIALDQINTFGSFASFGPIQQFFDPVIFLDPHSPPLALPLQEPDAQRLIAQSHQAPFGRGTETIIDDNVRKTWELNVNQFLVSNPHFNNTVRNAVTAAMAGLGVVNIAQAGVAPYKMLLYEKGALFKPHTDTEKVPGQFATLVICLPSAHEGGDIVLSHKGATKRFSTSTMQSSYACWYSDVMHEVEEVTSGYRLVLTYNIYRTSPLTAQLSASNMGEQYPGLKGALRNWRWSMGTEVVYILDHKYTDASLNVNSLKGADIGRVQALVHFAKKYDYEIFLATMEHMKTGEAEYDYDPWDRRGRRHYYGGRGNYDSDEDEEDGSEGEFHGITDIMDSETKLTRVIAPGGTQLITDRIVEESCLLDEEAFNGERDPDEHEYEGYTGNAGAQSTHWYRDTVVMLMPSGNLIPWLTHGLLSNSRYKKDVVPLLRWLVQRCHSSSRAARKTARSDLVQICQFVVKENATAAGRMGHIIRPELLPFPQHVVSYVCGILGKLRDYRTLASLISTAGQLSEDAFRMLNPAIEDRFAEIQDVLTEAFGKLNSVNATFEALTALFGGNLESRTGDMADWASGVLTKAASSISSPTEQDGKGLIRIAVHLGSVDFLQNCINVTIPSLINRTQFVLAFLATLVRMGKHAFPEEDIRCAVRSCTRRMVEVFYLEPAESQPHKRARTTEEPSSSNDSTAGNAPSDIAKVLEYLLENGLKSNAALLFAALETQVQVGRTDAIRQILVPFLKHAQPLARRYATNEHAPQFRSLYRSILEAYLERFVKKQPDTLENFARSRVRCSCQDCWQLNLCLISATQQECRFAVSKARRHHLHQMLDLSLADCTHETDRRTNTLVVRKRSKTRVEYNAWHIRCRECGDQLISFDLATLRDMLGDRYETIVGMRSLISDDTQVPEVVERIWRQLPLAQEPSPPVQTGSKRKIEVIDLGSDDSN